jgi:hypothetical protein
MAPAPTTGYSGTPLAKKLGYREGTHAHLVDAPAELATWLQPLPDGVRFEDRLQATTDLVHLFTTQRVMLQAHLQRWRQTLRSDACVWVSWPKKAAKVPTDITEDVIRTVALPLGFVDVKVCAVSEVWSGLKLVIRKELR